MEPVEGRAYARAGLVGNPSDAYDGKALAVEIREFAATVTLEPNEGLELIPGPADRPVFTSIADFASHARRHGFYGGRRLLAASTNAFAEHCSVRGIELDDRGFRMTYRTTVPRQVGLAGSSAIVVACLRALSAFYGVRIDRQVLPTLALQVETRELGIPAGLMDRVSQVWGGLVAMDLRPEAMTRHDGYARGVYQALDPALLPRLYLAYAPHEAEPTEVVHGSLTERYRRGDEAVLEAMVALAGLVDLAVAALRRGEQAELGPLMDRNYDLRRSVSPIAPGHARMIERARQAGAPAKFAGSGGAIVGVVPDDDVLERLRRDLSAIGCEVIVPRPGRDGHGGDGHGGDH